MESNILVICFTHLWKRQRIKIQITRLDFQRFVILVRNIIQIQSHLHLLHVIFFPRWICEWSLLNPWPRKIVEELWWPLCGDCSRPPDEGLSCPWAQLSPGEGLCSYCWGHSDLWPERIPTFDSAVTTILWILCLTFVPPHSLTTITSLSWLPRMEAAVQNAGMGQQSTHTCLMNNGPSLGWCTWHMSPQLGSSLCPPTSGSTGVFSHSHLLPSDMHIKNVRFLPKCGKAPKRQAH